jgi:hypothetical protein
LDLDQELLPKKGAFLPQKRGFFSLKRGFFDYKKEVFMALLLDVNSK